MKKSKLLLLSSAFLISATFMHAQQALAAGPQDNMTLAPDDGGGGGGGGGTTTPATSACGTPGAAGLTIISNVDTGSGPGQRRTETVKVEQPVNPGFVYTITLGNSVSVTAASGDTASSVASKLAAAVNAAKITTSGYYGSIAVTASPSGESVIVKLDYQHQIAANGSGTCVETPPVTTPVPTAGDEDVRKQIIATTGKTPEQFQQEAIDQLMKEHPELFQDGVVIPDLVGGYSQQQMDQMKAQMNEVNSQDPSVDPDPTLYDPVTGMPTNGTGTGTTTGTGTAPTTPAPQQ